MRQVVSPTELQQKIERADFLATQLHFVQSLGNVLDQTPLLIQPSKKPIARKSKSNGSTLQVQSSKLKVADPVATAVTNYARSIGIRNGHSEEELAVEVFDKIKYPNTNVLRTVLTPNGHTPKTITVAGREVKYSSPLSPHAVKIISEEIADFASRRADDLHLLWLRTKEDLMNSYQTFAEMRDHLISDLKDLKKQQNSKMSRATAEIERKLAEKKKEMLLPDDIRRPIKDLILYLPQMQADDLYMALTTRDTGVVEKMMRRYGITSKSASPYVALTYARSNRMPLTSEQFGVQLGRMRSEMQLETQLGMARCFKFTPDTAIKFDLYKDQAHMHRMSRAIEYVQGLIKKTEPYIS